MKVTIKVRLWGGFAALLALILGMAVIVKVGQDEQNTVTHRVTDVRLPVIVAATEVGSAVPSAKAACRDVLLSAAEPERIAFAKESWDKAWQRAHAGMDELVELSKQFVTQADRDRVKELADLLKQTQQVQGEAINLVKDADSGSAYAYLREKGTVAAKADELLTELVTSQREFAVKGGKDIDAISARNGSVVLMTAAVSLVLGVSAAFLIARSILRPLNLLKDRLIDISQGEGDLTVRLDEAAKDEIGDVSRGFNKFVEKIRATIVQTGEAAQQVAAAATQIAASSEQMSRAANQQEAQAGQVSAAIAEMSASVTEIAGKATNTALRAKEAGELAQECGRAVSTTVSDMTDINKVVDQSSIEIQNLGSKSEKIGEIVSVINEIADQTNLLALNAAIEAARAGEHGRGFAVVADEVRKLAERTTQATTEVGESIKMIRDGTRDAVTRVEAAAKRASEGTTRASVAGEGMKQIVGKASEVGGLVQSIAAASEQQSAAAEEVSRSMELVASSSRETASGAQQSTEAAADLSSRAESLRKLVSQFKT